MKEKERKMNEEKIKDLGDGPLCLFIACTECDAQYELNKAAVAWSVIGEVSFIDFVRFIQNSQCHKCGKTDAPTSMCEGIEENSL